MRFVICLIVGLLAQPALGEPFVVAQSNGQFQVKQSEMDAASRVCLYQTDAGADRISACMGNVHARCTSEQPNFAQARTRDLQCLWAAGSAWNEIMRVTVLRSVNQLGLQDARESSRNVVGPPRVQSFAPAQEAWEAYRKAECALASSRHRSEPFAQAMEARCRLDKAIERVVELRSYVR